MNVFPNHQPENILGACGLLHAANAKDNADYYIDVIFREMSALRDTDPAEHQKLAIHTSRVLPRALFACSTTGKSQVHGRRVNKHAECALAKHDPRSLGDLPAYVYDYEEVTRHDKFVPDLTVIKERLADTIAKMTRLSGAYGVMLFRPDMLVLEALFRVGIMPEPVILNRTHADYLHWYQQRPLLEDHAHETEEWQSSNDRQVANYEIGLAFDLERDSLELFPIESFAPYCFETRILKRHNFVADYLNLR